MIKPHVLKNLQELNTLKLKKESIEREAVELWNLYRETKNYKIQDKISVLHGKMNTLQHRITYLHNLKGVQQAIWVTAKGEASDIIYKGVDPCWDYSRAIAGEGCSWCENDDFHAGARKRRGLQ